MQQTGSDLLSYHGDAALGLNSQGLENYGDTDMKELNNSVFNMAYLNQQKNKAVWDQKIKDRDDAMKLIADGALNVGNALPGDRPKLMAKLDELKNQWIAHGGDLKSDPNVWLKFNQGIGDFKSASTVAASRYLTYNNGMAEMAKEVRPDRIKAMKNHWNGELKKDIYEPFDPYQHQMDYDFKTVLPDDNPVNTTTTQDKFNDYVTTKTDVKKTVDQLVTKYQYDDKGMVAPQVDAFVDNFFGRDGLKDLASVGQSVNYTNSRLAKIATDEGFDPSDEASLPEYLKPIKLLSVDPTTVDPKTGKGVPGFTDTKQMAWAKIVLGAKYQNATAPKWNKDRAKYDIDKEKADAYREAQNAAARKANAYTNYLHLKSQGIKDQEKSVSNIYGEILSNQKDYPGIFGGMKGDNTGGKVVYANDIAPGYRAVLGGVDKDGNPVELKPFVGQDNEGNPIGTVATDKKDTGVKATTPYFRVEESPYYVLPDGSTVTDDYIDQMYQKQHTYTDKKDYVQNVVEKKFHGKKEKLLRGANGTANERSTLQALKAATNISNKNKGDISIFDNGGGSIEPPTTTSETTSSTESESTTQ